MKKVAWRVSPGLIVAAVSLYAFYPSENAQARKPALETAMNGLARQKPVVPDLPGRKLGFLVTYFSAAMYQGEGSCPTGMHKVVTVDDYLAKVAPAERQRLLLPANQRELAVKMVERGPNGENLCRAPWAVKDAQLTTLSGDRNDGLDLDGWKGSGSAPANVCAQKQYVGDDGEPGVDNQYGRIFACVGGLREKGTVAPFFVEQMRTGSWSMLIEVSGVQDARNDTDVIIDIFGGADPMPKDSAGNILANGSLSAKPDPNLHTRLTGAIRDGVLTTDVSKEVTFPSNTNPSRPPISLFRSKLKLTLLPDGKAKGYLGGYMDIRSLFTPGALDGGQESLSGYSCEGMYHSLRRYADGKSDPQAATCDQISAAYRIEAVPAFVIRPRGFHAGTFR